MVFWSTKKPDPDQAHADALESGDWKFDSRDYFFLLLKAVSRDEGGFLATATGLATKVRRN